MVETTASSDRERLCDEEAVVRQNRYYEALDAGVGHDVADEFSKNRVDVGLLRKLVARSVAPKTIARLIR